MTLNAVVPGYQTETLFQGFRLVTQQAVYAIAVLTYTGGQCGAGGRYNRGGVTKYRG